MKSKKGKGLNLAEAKQSNLKAKLFAEKYWANRKSQKENKEL